MKTDAGSDQATFLVAPVAEIPLIPLDDVTQASYQTQKFDSTSPDIFPAYKIEVLRDPSKLYNADTDDDAQAYATYLTLVFEPIYQPGAHPTGLHTWDTLAVDGKWWATTVTTLGARGTTFTWDAFLAAYPQAAVLRYGAGVGSGLDTVLDAKFDAVRFAYLDSRTEEPVEVCTRHVWVAAAPPTNAPQPNAPLPDYSDTGVKVTQFVVAGAALLIAGAVLMLATRRRRAISR